jgi:hypothetical protein
MIVLATAHGLKVTAAAMVPSAAGSEVVSVQTDLTHPPRIVSIRGVDATTHDRAQVVCLSSGDEPARVTNDEMLVALQDIPSVAAEVCNAPSVPPLRWGSAY